MVKRSQSIVSGFRVARRTTQAFVVCSLLTALLSGCAAVHVPDYRRPEAPVKSSWSRLPLSAASATEAISPEWWQEFGDPYLDSLVAKAIAENVDLKVLAARITVANAQIAEVRAGALPSADIAAGTAQQNTTGHPFSQQYNVGGRVLWDIDIWGAVEKGVEGQRAEFHATEADWRAGYLQIVADVSTTYFQILEYDEQIDRQQHALSDNEQILAIDETLHSNGLLSDSDVLRQRAELSRLTKELVELHRNRDVTENALATLLGVPAGQFKIPPDRLQGRVQVPTVAATLPLDLLSRRPDVVAAEFRVLEAHDLMGQARLAQLPTVSLTGQAGGASVALNALLKAFTVGLMPSIDIPAFNPGVKAHIKTTEAQIKVAEESYRRTVIAAFEEVENALVNLEAHRREREELQQQVAQLQAVSEQTKTQLQAGVVTQLQVFEDERSLLAAQLALLDCHEQMLSDTVTLYKALGGGWAPTEVANARR
jgi:NodT family efflux transporter outer membrane factor (OMF) lipoprotein